jgi:hypothetical protein
MLSWTAVNDKWLLVRIPGHADHDSGMMAIAIPG